jgi:putative membrane protein
VLDVWTLAPLALFAAIAATYARGVAVMWRRAGAGRGVRPGQVCCFALGAGCLIAVATPWLHEAADENVAAHMAQHVLLMVVAPPLLVLSRPLAALVLALPVSFRSRVGGLAGGAGRLALAEPGVYAAALASAVALWVWHAPFAYDAAVRHESLHALEHATILSTSLLLWWTIAESARRGTRATVLAMASSVTAGLQGSALGLLMVVSATPWYAVYGSGPAALDDQRTAGALMWGATGGVYVLAVALLLWRLLEQAEGAAPQPREAEI